MSSNDRNATGPIDLLLVSTGTALLLLTIEWLIVGAFGFGLQQDEVARTLSGLLLLGLCTGLAACCAALLLRRYGAVAAFAAAVAILLFMEMFAVLGDHTVAKLLGAGGLAVLAFLLIVQQKMKLPAWLLRPAISLAVVSALFALALLQTVTSAVDSTGIWLAVAASFIAAMLLVFWRRSKEYGKRPLLPVLGLLVLLAASMLLGSRVPVWQPDNNFAADRPSVLLVTIDTLRADRVGAYGYDKANTPTLDSLAQQGVLFRQAVSPSGYTGPSHTSILTGLLPKRHGALTNIVPLQDEIPTLADILRSEGYVTGAFVSAFPLYDRSSALPSRFHAFNDDTRQLHWLPPEASSVAGLYLANRLMEEINARLDGYEHPRYRMGADTAEIAIRWLEQNGGRALFTWVHFFDPHLPYQKHGGNLEGMQGLSGAWYKLTARERSEIVSSPDKMAAMRAMYDAEISYADAQLARVVEAARQAAPDGRLLVVVTSDHGMQMGEHNLYWSRRLYDPTIMVPLIIAPHDDLDGMRREVETQVRLVDLMPTILDLVNVPQESDLDGASLADLMKGTSVESPGPAFSSIYRHAEDYEREQHSVREDGWKLIRKYSGWEGKGSRAALPGEVDEELYNLAADPAENDNLAESLTVLKKRLETRLDELDPVIHVQQELHLSPADRERLRGLGYVQ